MSHPLRLSSRSVALVVLIAGARAQTALPAIEKNIVYGVADGIALKMDLHVPSVAAPATPRPVVMFIHGGSWNSGCRDPIPPTCTSLLQAGIAIASIDYRFTNATTFCGGTPPVGWTGAAFPAQIHDAKAAVRWLHYNAASRGLDPDRIGVHGVSAGGHLAMLLAASNGEASLEGTVGPYAGIDVDDSRVAVASAWAPPTDFYTLAYDDAEQLGGLSVGCTNWNTCFVLADFFGWAAGLGDITDPAHWMSTSWPYDRLTQLVLDASVTTWIQGNEPPMLLMNGTLDETVPTNQSTRLSATLYAHDAWHVFRPLLGEPHHGPPADANPAFVEFYTRFYRDETLPTSNSALFCFGHSAGGTATVCPCGNDSFPGAREGCKNAQLVGGVEESLVGGNLDVQGTADVGSGDTLILHADGMSSGTSFYWQGRAQVNGGFGTAFADGLSCIGGPFIRLGIKTNTKGCSRYPEPEDDPISVQGLVNAGETYVYQVVYDHAQSFCPPASSNTTNAVQITW